MCVTTEWAKNEVNVYWSTVHFRRKMIIGKSGIGPLYPGMMPLPNMGKCVYPNAI